jgi:hypothetical protein
MKLHRDLREFIESLKSDEVEYLVRTKDLADVEALRKTAPPSP